MENKKYEVLPYRYLKIRRCYWFPFFHFCNTIFVMDKETRHIYPHRTPFLKYKLHYALEWGPTGLMDEENDVERLYYDVPFGLLIPLFFRYKYVKASVSTPQLSRGICGHCAT